MNISVKHALAIGLLLLVPAQKAAKAQSSGGPGGATPPRVPRGIYAVVRIEEVLTKGYGSNPGYGDVPDPTPAVNSYLKTFYDFLLNNPAVSGLALQVHWDTLNPNPPGDANAYSWDYVQDAFDRVENWNTKNPDNLKTIQLIVAPGFNTPKWMLDEFYSCDPIFENAKRFLFIGCGKVTFTNFDEEDQADGNVLPLPWNATYQAAWKTFLQALAAKYNDQTALVSVSVAGPTAVSAEMILPSGDEVNQMQFVSRGGTPGGISANQMWIELTQLFYYGEPSFQGTDQPFVAAWDHAIDTYGEIFSGLTLVATTGNGLPNLAGGDTPPPGEFPDPGPPATPINFATDCTADQNMDCQAETQILSYFVEAYPVGGSNAKATQTSGLEVQREGAYLGINGVKFLSQQTAAPPAGTSQVLGGAQFNTSVSKHANAEGCPEGETCSLNPDQALYDVLQDFFTETSIAGQYCEPEPQAPAFLNYLQIYYQDFVYAGVAKNEGQISVNSAGNSGKAACGNVKMYFQGELNAASTQLLGITEP